MIVRIWFVNQQGWNQITGPLTRETASSYIVGDVTVNKSSVLPNGFEVLPDEQQEAPATQGQVGGADG